MVTALRCVLGLVIVLAASRPASAVWIIIKNDTDKTVVIQATSVVNGKLVKGKEYSLTPGEVLKEFQSGAGEKTVLVSEKDGNQPPAKATLSWGKVDASFAVTKDGTDVKLGPVKGK
jgi:hypothetical protein